MQISAGVAEDRFSARLVWDGNLGEGTTSYTSYGRGYRVLVAGKPDIAGSAAAAFRGNAECHNPEELFLAALSACHMLFYLSLCARRGVHVLSYEDDVSGTLTMHEDGGGRLSEVTLSPVVTIAPDADKNLALALHETAHGRCFLANSCSVPILHNPMIRLANGASARAEGIK